jgi:hypothetical protein
MKLELVLAAAFATLVVGLGTWSYFYGSPMPKAALPSSLQVAPAPLLSVYNASPKIEPDEGALKREDVMLERCQAGGGIPVMGYGWRVVCLKPEAADWWDDPQHPRSKP